MCEHCTGACAQPAQRAADPLDALIREEGAHLAAVAQSRDRRLQQNPENIVRDVLSAKAEQIELLGGLRKVFEVEVDVPVTMEWGRFLDDNYPTYGVMMGARPAWISSGGKFGEAAMLSDYVTPAPQAFVPMRVEASSIETATNEIRLQLYKHASIGQLVLAEDWPNIRKGQRILPVMLRLLELKQKYLEMYVEEFVQQRGGGCGLGAARALLEYEYHSTKISDTKRLLEKFSAELGNKKSQHAKAWVMLSAAPSTPLVFGTLPFDNKACFGPNSAHEYRYAPGVIGSAPGMISALMFDEDPTGREREWELSGEHVTGRAWGVLKRGVVALHNVYAGNHDTAAALIREAGKIAAGIDVEQKPEVGALDRWVRYCDDSAGYLYVNYNDGGTSRGDAKDCVWISPGSAFTAPLSLITPEGFLRAPMEPEEDDEEEIVGECQNCGDNIREYDEYYTCPNCGDLYCASCWSTELDHAECNVTTRHACSWDDGRCAHCQPRCYDCSETICLNAPVSPHDGCTRCTECHNIHMEEVEEQRAAEEESTTEPTPTEGESA